jgi:hypothetical protein
VVNDLKILVDNEICHENLILYFHARLCENARQECFFGPMRMSIAAVCTVGGWRNIKGVAAPYKGLSSER